MASLALRNLLHDKVRLGVTLTGIVFAIILIIVQLGLFLGFTQMTSNIIRQSKADLWVAGAGLRNFDVGLPFSEAKYYQVLATPGVETAEKYIVQFVNWKVVSGPRAGAQESIEIIGINPDSTLGLPWNLTEGSAADLKQIDAVIVDEFYKDKLGVHKIGDTAEIQGRRARVVGFTTGVRSFTTSPYVFTWFKNALNYSRVEENQTVYALIKAAPGVDLQELKRRVAAGVRDVDVYTTDEFAKKTTNYWMFTTGAGVSVLIAAAMGLLVGLVVVAQTIYATTMDHIREYGTLKAMGASNGYIYRVIIQQSIIAAVMGYALAMAVAIPLVKVSQKGNALILLPWELAVAMFFIAAVMCILASVVSINKVTSIDPAMVFKG